MRKAAGKKSVPTVAVVDSQSVRTAEGGEERGHDSAKKVTGRKRHLAVDTLGLLLAVIVHGTNCQDQGGAKRVLSQLGERFRRIKVMFGEVAYGRSGLPVWTATTFG